MTQSKRPLKVFLCHAHADRDAVRALYTRLTNDGVDAWLDKEKLLPGQDWELEIKKAVREADVVVVCLSKQFNQAGFRQKEVRLALDTAMEQPEGEIFIIPARLEECDNLESLRKWHWVDLFEDDGYEMLIRAMQMRAQKIGAFVSRIDSDIPVNIFNRNFESEKILNTGSRKIGIGLMIFMLLVSIIYFGYQYSFSSFEEKDITPTSIANTEPLSGETLIVTTPTSLPLPPISKVVNSNLPNPTTCPQWLLFHSFREDNLDIFRLDGIEGEDNFSIINITKNDAVDSRPSRSPKGDMIVYQSNRTGNVELFLVDSFGEITTQLTNTPNMNNWNPVFSSDGKKIIYQSDRNGTMDIYLLNLEESRETQLTTNLGNDVFPYWSPDPDWLVFQSDRSGLWRIYLLNINTGKEYQIDETYSKDLFSTKSSGDFDLIFPSWSPDGEFLAFYYSESGLNTLVISDLQGRVLYTSPTYAGEGLNNYEWSPDGSRIAYQKQVDQNFDVYVYDLIANIEYRLTDYDGIDSSPSWSCNGDQIAFTSIRDGDPNIYRVPWNGGEIKKVTIDIATDKWASWSSTKNFSSIGY